jgi:hypothetical protein
VADFKLKQNPTFWRPVGLKNLDGEVQTLELELRHKTKTQLKAFYALLASEDKPSDEDLVRDLVAGWRKVDTDFSEEALMTLMDQYPAAAGEIWADYQAAYQDAARKNS